MWTRSPWDSCPVRRQRVSDADGDGIRDQVTARLPDPYGGGFIPAGSLQWPWALLVLVLLLIVAIVFLIFVRRTGP